jgi:hypothetical protein
MVFSLGAQLLYPPMALNMAHDVNPLNFGGFNHAGSYIPASSMLCLRFDFC